MNNNKARGIIALVIAAILWGGEFVVEKDVLFYIEPNWSNAIRFFICVVFCLIVWRKKFKKASLVEWKNGMISGAFMGFGFAFQTMGLEYINAGINAFLCAAYILVIPLFVWKIERIRPRRIVFICALIALTGVLLMSVQGNDIKDFSVGIGEILTLIGSVFYAGGIVSVDYYAEQMDSKLLAGMQFIAIFIISLGFALIFESVPSEFTIKIGIEFIYLIIGASLFAQLLFTYGMKYVSSALAGNIFLLESTSAMFLGILFLHEKVSFIQIGGSMLILVAIIFLNRDENRHDT